jgi:hypothetical protein
MVGVLRSSVEPYVIELKLSALVGIVLDLVCFWLVLQHAVVPFFPERPLAAVARQQVAGQSSFGVHSHLLQRMD